MTPRHLVSVLAPTLLLLACGATPAQRTPARPEPAATTDRGDKAVGEDWASKGCDQPEPMPQFVGQEADAAAHALGTPEAEERFALGKGMNEFRVELRNDFPLPANADLMVLERTWAKDDCRLTLWAVERSGAWRVARATRWPAGATF